MGKNSGLRDLSRVDLAGMLSASQVQVFLWTLSNKFGPKRLTPCTDLRIRAIEIGVGLSAPSL